MSLLSRIVKGAVALFRHDDSDLEDELLSYQQYSTEGKMRRGLSSEQARRAAWVEMGSREAVKDEVRDAGWESAIHSIVQDVRYGARMLRKAPVVTVICVVTLGLAIGVNAAIFSVVNFLLFTPLPVRHPEQLVFLAYPREEQHFDEFFSWAELQELRPAAGAVFSDSAALIFGGVNGQSVRDGLTVDGHTEKVEPVYVSGSFFSMLGVRPHLGRLLLPGEGEARGADPVIVLSYRYWMQRFGGDARVIGKQVLFDGVPVTIVGVAAKGFAGVTPLIEMQAYVPLGMAAQIGQTGRDFYAKPDTRAAILFARLRPGVTSAQAESALAGVSERLKREFPRPRTGQTLMVRALRPPGLINGPNPLPGVAALFLTLAAMVLALAGVNIAALLLARAAARRTEMAVRAALGAARLRLLRQMITESVLLAALGCLAGIVVGQVATVAMLAVPMQTEEAFNLDFHFDWRVLGYLCAVSLVTGLAVGITPALRAVRGSLSQVLHSSERGSSSSRQRFRNALVVLQVGGALALIVAAGLFLRSLRGAERADLGFDPVHVLNLSFDPHEIGYTRERAEEFYRAVQQRVSSLPGVRSASLAAAVPLGETPFGTQVLLPGQSPGGNRQALNAVFNEISPEYFDTMGMKLLQGRNFNAADRAGSPDVALVTPALAQRLWPNQDPIGRTFFSGEEPKRPLLVVGMVNNSRYTQVYDPWDALYFVPLAQHFMMTQTLQVRTAGKPEDAAAAILGAVAAVDSTMPIYGVRNMSDALHGFNGLLMFEFAAGLAAILGGMGLLLAMVGVYGVLSYGVSQRTRELGIRMALGAPRPAVIRMVVRQGLKTVATGLVLGMLLAFVVGRLLADFLVGVSPADPLTYITVTLLLASVAVPAALLPARRATRIDPVVALRAE